MHKIISLIFLLLFSYATQATPKIIFDTDFGSDADDLGALAMLNHMHNAEECELIAVMNWNTERYALPAIAAVNRFYGNAEIPIGTRKDGLWREPAQHSKAIVDKLGAPVQHDQVPDTTSLYRQLLSEAEDGSITIVTVGPLLNILNLLNSQSDEHSNLSGQELVTNKVEKFVIMGGQYPSGDWEWNFNGNMPGVTQETLAKIDVPIIFSGYEIGQAIKTGKALNKLDKEHPLYIGYLHFSEHAEWMKDQFTGDISDNASYDQTAVLFAVRSKDNLWRLSQPGWVIADEKGGNIWRADAEGKHRYLILDTDRQKIADIILNTMLGNL